MELCYALHIHYSLEMLRTVLARILSLQQGKLTNESQEGTEHMFFPILLSHTKFLTIAPKS